MEKTVAIVQSSYIPWQGYFELIYRADVFVFLDSVQFTRRDWRTRNRIKTSQGTIWLSVPVLAKNHRDRSIFEIQIDNSSKWSHKHIKSIDRAYAKAPFCQDAIRSIASVYHNPPQKLVELNRSLTIGLWNYASGNTEKTFMGDEQFDLNCNMEANDRLIHICRTLNATTYLSGPAAKDYLNLDKWKDNNINVEFVRYSCTPYPQLHGTFTPYVSMVDTVAHLGYNCINLLYDRALQA